MIKKRLKQIAVLALLVLAVVLIHIRVQQEAEEAAQETAEAVAQPEAVDDAQQSMTVIRLGDEISLGTVSENTERGGIDVAVPQPDGSEIVYTFTDVAIDSWYVDAVNFVVSANLMKGMGDDPIFHPEYGILREELASILYRYTNGRQVSPNYRYDDVPEGAWYFDSVSWVTNLHLMSGQTSTFGVGEYMTCEQALIALYRLAGEPETDGSLLDYPYAAKVSEYARDAVDWAWKSGLITEEECVWYPPQAISRAQVALLLTRFSTMSE